MVRFIHITDTHIGPTPHFALYGKQPLQYLQRLVNRINDLPFNVDFVLHTGDCVDDGSAEGYALFRETMAQVRFPCRYVVGNHDNVRRLQTDVMAIKTPTERLDYTFDVGGVRFVVLDTRGPIDPAGKIEASQIEWLKKLSTPDGPPMVIAMHHVPFHLDTPWIDTSPPGWNGRYMYVDGAAELRAILKPAASRIRGIFSGHVHGLYQTMQDGLLMFAGQSAFAPVCTWPNSDRVYNDEEQPAMFNLVTVTNDQIIVRPRCFELPR